MPKTVTAISVPGVKARRSLMSLLSAVFLCALVTGALIWWKLPNIAAIYYTRQMVAKQKWPGMLESTPATASPIPYRGTNEVSVAGLRFVWPCGARPSAKPMLGTFLLRGEGVDLLVIGIDREPGPSGTAQDAEYCLELQRLLQTVPLSARETLALSRVGASEYMNFINLKDFIQSSRDMHRAAVFESEHLIGVVPDDTTRPMDMAHAMVFSRKTDLAIGIRIHAPETHDAGRLLYEVLSSMRFEPPSWTTREERMRVIEHDLAGYDRIPDSQRK